MNTTNLFVELIVVGSGAVIWLGLLLTAALRLDPAFWGKTLGMTSLAIPALALTYVLGIVVDRLTDVSLLKKNGADEKETAKKFYTARARALDQSEAYERLYEYNRIRQRVCRGWFVNSIAILIASNVLFLGRPGLVADNQPLLDLVVSGTAAILAFGCYLSWKALVKTERERLAEHIAYLDLKPH